MLIIKIIVFFKPSIIDYSEMRVDLWSEGWISVDRRGSDFTTVRVYIRPAVGRWLPPKIHMEFIGLRYNNMIGKHILYHHKR